jgi:hypothetical protein
MAVTEEYDVRTGDGSGSLDSGPGPEMTVHQYQPLPVQLHAQSCREERTHLSGIVVAMDRDERSDILQPARYVYLGKVAQVSNQVNG